MIDNDDPKSLAHNQLRMHSDNKEMSKHSEIEHSLILYNNRRRWANARRAHGYFCLAAPGPNALRRPGALVSTNSLKPQEAATVNPISAAAFRVIQKESETRR